MNTSVIERLLDRFYEGKTTLREENILRDFFREGDVPAYLKPHQALFAYYHSEQNRELRNPDFEQDLMAEISHESAEMPVIANHPTRRRLLFFTGIAAGIVILTGLFFTFQQDVFKKSWNQNRNPGAEIAYHDASRALMMVSANLNTGLKQVERFRIVDKAMKNMQIFNKFYQYQTIIINPDEILNQSIKSK